MSIKLRFLTAVRSWPSERVAVQLLQGRPGQARQPGRRRMVPLLRHHLWQQRAADVPGTLQQQSAQVKVLEVLTLTVASWMECDPC